MKSHIARIALPSAIAVAQSKALLHPKQGFTAAYLEFCGMKLRRTRLPRGNFDGILLPAGLAHHLLDSKVMFNGLWKAIVESIHMEKNKVGMFLPFFTQAAGQCASDQPPPTFQPGSIPAASTKL